MQGKTAPNETVMAAKKFLDGELAKSKDINQFNESIKLVENKSQYDKLKQTGVGQTTLLKFLGGNWKQWLIWPKNILIFLLKLTPRCSIMHQQDQQNKGLYRMKNVTRHIWLPPKVNSAVEMLTRKTSTVVTDCILSIAGLALVRLA